MWRRFPGGNLEFGWKKQIIPSIAHHVRLEMKPGRAVLLSFAIIAVCIVSYEVFDQPAARFCSTIDDRITYIFDLITRFGISTPYLAAALAGFIYFKFIKKNEILANAAVFLFLGRRPLRTCERSDQGAGWKKQARAVVFPGRIRVQTLYESILLCLVSIRPRQYYSRPVLRIERGDRPLQVSPAEYSFGCNGQPCYSGGSFPERRNVRGLPGSSCY